MLNYLEIKAVHAREILDSRGNPTVEAEVTVYNQENNRYFTGVINCLKIKKHPI